MLEAVIPLQRKIPWERQGGCSTSILDGVFGGPLNICNNEKAGRGSIPLPTPPLFLFIVNSIEGRYHHIMVGSHHDRQGNLLVKPLLSKRVNVDTKMNSPYYVFPEYLQEQCNPHSKSDNPLYRNYPNSWTFLDYVEEQVIDFIGNYDEFLPKEIGPNFLRRNRFHSLSSYCRGVQLFDSYALLHEDYQNGTDTLDSDGKFPPEYIFDLFTNEFASHRPGVYHEIHHENHGMIFDSILMDYFNNPGMGIPLTFFTRQVDRKSNTYYNRMADQYFSTAYQISPPDTRRFGNDYESMKLYGLDRAFMGEATPSLYYDLFEHGYCDVDKEDFSLFTLNGVEYFKPTLMELFNTLPSYAFSISLKRDAKNITVEVNPNSDLMSTGVAYDYVVESLGMVGREIVGQFLEPNELVSAKFTKSWLEDLWVELDDGVGVPRMYVIDNIYTSICNRIFCI